VLVVETTFAILGLAVWLVRGTWLVEATRAGPDATSPGASKAGCASRRVVEEFARALELGHGEIQPTGVTRL
jgi:hypothetical protein